MDELHSLMADYARYINPSKVDYLKKAGLLFVEEEMEGSIIRDTAGKKYFDCRDDAGVFNFGHRNPEILQTLRSALDEFDIGNNLFLSRPRADLAKSLVTLLPGQACVNFGVSGGEIADLAIKIATAYSKRKGVIGARKGYHGCTGIALSASGEKAYHDPFLPIVREYQHVPFGDIRAMERAIGRDTACVILEPIQGHAGVVLPPHGYFQRVRELCDEHGVILIVDEIQTGLGRCGTILAIEQEGIVPDMVLLGKALSGGFTPITAVVYKREFQKFWEEYPMSHQSSFGGNELACAVALKVLELARDPALLAQVREGANRIAEFFAAARERHASIIKDFRQRGYLMCLEVAREDLGFELSGELCRNGVIVEPLTHDPVNLRIMISLNIPMAQLEEILTIFGRSLEVVAERERTRHPVRTALGEIVRKVAG